MFSPHAKHQKLYLQLCICVDTGGNNVHFFYFISVFFDKNAIHLSKSSSIIVVSVTFFFSLAITCASYVLIRQQTRQNFPGIRAQQNKKLTNTLLIETVVSAFCWLPMIICSAVFGWSSIEDVASDHSYYTLLIVKTLQYFNSMVNLIP